jgi:archaemetzincin
MASLSLLAINGLDLSLIERIPAKLEHIFKVEARIRRVSLDMEPFYHRKRAQYHSSGFLKKLHGMREGGEEKVIGVTDLDLFAPVLTFVFGEAQLGGPAAVLSTHRLRNELYGLPPSEVLLIERVTKEAIHEIGHTMGILHCPDYSCAMHFSNSIDAIDIKYAALCRMCTERLREMMHTGRTISP